MSHIGRQGELEKLNGRETPPPPPPDPAYFLSSSFVSDFRNYAAKQSVGRRKRLKRAGIWQGKEQNSRAGLS